MTTLALVVAMLCGMGVFAGSEISTSSPPQNTAECITALQESQVKREYCCVEKVMEGDIRQLQLEKEMYKVNEKFAELVGSGVFRQLNWTNAIQRLQTLRDELKFVESQSVADAYILKVRMMAKVQEVFIENCKGYVFAKFRLARHAIADVSEKELSLVKPDGKTPVKMTWVKFYRSCHSNLNELIVKFIENGKDVSKLKDGKCLSLQPWAETMMGAALVIQIICGDDPTAAIRAEQIAKNAVKAYPDYLKKAQAIFPDITFEVEEDDSAQGCLKKP